MFKSIRLISIFCVILAVMVSFGYVLAQGRLRDIPEVEINTQAGVVRLVEVNIGDRYPSGCNPNVRYSCFAIAPSGYNILFVILSAPPGDDVLDQDIYVTEPGSNTRHDIELGGLSDGLGMAAFAVPKSANNFVLYWPENLPIPLDDDDDGVWIYEDVCPEESGVSVADGCPDSDTDTDGVNDSVDACPDVIGSEGAQGCPDADEDTVADTDDKCPDQAGSAQAAGCPDADGDGLPDTEDNCPDVRNMTQSDADADGIGDACEDSDEDGVYDHVDNCPAEIGTANGCPDADEDGVADVDDVCPEEAGSAQAAGCPDSDGDGLVDTEDNCPDVKNPPQRDFNDDGIGDACQDSDDDGVKDSSDRCPNEAGTVNGCTDADEDGVAGAEDQCPENAGTVEGCPDSDEDGVADVNDQCPEDAGTVEGCPDSDEDGLIDQDDDCPDEAGLLEANGCLITAVVKPESGTVNLRKGPGTEFTIAGTATSEDQLAILGRNEAGGWLRIRLLPKEEGGEALEAWIADWLVTTEATIESLPVIK